MAVAFDTLKYTENLKLAGFSEPQAKAMSEAQKEVLLEIVETQVATKLDMSVLNNKIGKIEVDLYNKIDRVEADLHNKIDRVEADLHNKIDKVETDLTNKIDHLE